MAQAVELAQVWRGGRLESLHRGHAVVVDGGGAVVQAWGDPGLLVYPRSSAKMIQALPLVESGAAAARGLGADRLALACASHNAAAIHVDPVNAWMAELGLDDAAFRCGPQEPRDLPMRDALIRAHQAPCQVHNNCSGKHAGFLTLAAHLGAGPEYLEIDHPVQIAAREAFEDATGEDSPSWAIDGCSAPNHACTLAGLARAMARFATAQTGQGARAEAMLALRRAMVAHPELVAGEGRACTALMRAMDGVAVKTGAEGVFVAILPGQGLGVAVKAEDGATRAAESAIAQVLVRLGALPADHPVATRLIHGPITNWRGLRTGEMRPGTAFA